MASQSAPLWDPMGPCAQLPEGGRETMWCHWSPFAVENESASLWSSLHAIFVLPHRLRKIQGKWHSSLAWMKFSNMQGPITYPHYGNMFLNWYSYSNTKLYVDKPYVLLAKVGYHRWLWNAIPDRWAVCWRNMEWMAWSPEELHIALSLLRCLQETTISFAPRKRLFCRKAKLLKWFSLPRIWQTCGKDTVTQRKQGFRTQLLGRGISVVLWKWIISGLSGLVVVHITLSGQRGSFYSGPE